MISVRLNCVEKVFKWQARMQVACRSAIFGRSLNAKGFYCGVEVVVRVSSYGLTPGRISRPYICLLACRPSPGGRSSRPTMVARPVRYTVR